MLKSTDSVDRGVIHQIDALEQMSVGELRKKWSDLFGQDGSHLGRAHLVRRLAYRIQELTYGGLSGEAQKQLKAWALDPDKQMRRAPRERANLQPGTRLVRDWHGVQHEVVVQQDGFLFDGKTYRSLSAIARAITGRHCGGRRFFGLQPIKPNRKQR